MNSTIATAIVVAIATLVLQKVLVNVLYGISMIFTRPFKKGDKVYIRKNGTDIASGNVIRRGLLQTKIKSYNRDVAILFNSELENCCIINSDYKSGTNHIEYICVTSDSNLHYVEDVVKAFVIYNHMTLNTEDNTNIIMKYETGHVRIQYNVRTNDIETSYDVCSDICKQLICVLQHADDVTLI